ncbi:MAG: thiamine pyrophosphate-binding protein [Chloroflexi bacterium]|nr:MAG: thiamine pyrophosphate-binding protein [Chloroflexota bacterium]
MSRQVRARTGGHLIIECLEALGAEVVFGLPGIHALPMWEGLRSSRLRTLNFRTELNAGFAADGYARVSGKAAPLLLSTGPGALNSLTALMEAATAYVPVVAISSQIPRDMIGKRRGFLHDLHDQLASFEPIVKWAARVERTADLPDVLTEGWRQAMTPPSGPVYVEVPVDLLRGEVDEPGVGDLRVKAATPSAAAAGSIREAASLLATATRPVIWAGGGVLRSRGWDVLAALAERLDAPVATTYMGKGAFREDHPLSAGSTPDDHAFQELLQHADVVLCVGTELGAETTAQYALHFEGHVIQTDADPLKIGATYPALGLVGDARVTLEALLEVVAAVAGRVEIGKGTNGAKRAQEVRQRVSRGLDQQGRELERGLLASIRDVLPRDAVTAWDMTILGYWAAAQFPALTPRRFLYPLGSGTLGYAWPAALGAKAALPDTASLAVVGDGGFLYGAAELLTARQHRLDAKLLLIDDGGYGILREYQRESFGATHAVDLIQPDFRQLCEACGVPVRVTTAEAIGDDLRWAFGVEGPAVVVFRGLLTAAQPTS